MARLSPSRLNLLTLIVLAGLTLLVFLLQIQWSPPNFKIHPDGSVFGYAGQRILEGDVPYRDFWDHKPPGVFYLNALAFAVGGSDAWSIWGLTLFWTLLIGIAFFLVLRRAISTLLAGIFTGVLLATILQPKFYEGSNLTEFYGVLPIVLALLFTELFLRERKLWQAVAIGGTLMAAGLSKHSFIGTPLVCLFVVLFYVWRKEGSRSALKIAAVLIAPALALLVLIIAYWGYNGALNELWQDTIQYNYLYIRAPWSAKKLYAIVRNLAVDPTLAPLLILSLAGALVFLSRYRNTLRGWLRNGSWPHYGVDIDMIYLTAFIAVPIEILMMSIQHRNFNRYYLALIPALCLAATYISSNRPVSQSSTPGVEGSRREMRFLVYAALSIWFVVIAGFVRPSSDDLRSFALDAPSRVPLETNIGRYVEQVTQPTDSVLIWGAGAELNFETARRSPTVYFSNLPLWTPGFQNSERWAELLSDLESDPPALIVAQVGKVYAPDPFTPSDQLASACNCSGDILQGFTKFSEFVQSNYEKELWVDGSFAFYHRTTP